jgi:hypothetical protein
MRARLLAVGSPHGTHAPPPKEQDPVRVDEAEPRGITRNNMLDDTGPRPPSSPRQLIRTPPPWLSRFSRVSREGFSEAGQGSLSRNTAQNLLAGRNELQQASGYPTPSQGSSRDSQASTLHRCLTLTASPNSGPPRSLMRCSVLALAQRQLRITRRTRNSWSRLSFTTSSLPTGRLQAPITPQNRPGCGARTKPFFAA